MWIHHRDLILFGILYNGTFPLTLIQVRKNDEGLLAPSRRTCFAWDAEPEGRGATEKWTPSS